jgi:hypothetical protein
VSRRHECWWQIIPGDLAEASAAPLGEGGPFLSSLKLGPPGHFRLRFCIPVVEIMLSFATARLDAAAVLRVWAAGRPMPTISDVAVIFCNFCDSLWKE